VIQQAKQFDWDKKIIGPDESTDASGYVVVNHGSLLSVKHKGLADAITSGWKAGDLFKFRWRGGVGTGRKWKPGDGERV
jgi:hypothetical protein